MLILQVMDLMDNFTFSWDLDSNNNNNNRYNKWFFSQYKTNKKLKQKLQLTAKELLPDPMKID